MRGSFFLLKQGKTSSGGVGKDRLKKFLGKSDVARAPVVLVPVLKKKNTFTLHAIERWLSKNSLEIYAQR